MQSQLETSSELPMDLINLLCNTKDITDYNLILKSGFDLDESLICAAQLGNLTLFKYYESNGAKDYDRALLAASSKNQTRMINHLLAMGVKNLSDALMAAASNGAIGAVKILLKQIKNNVSDKTLSSRDCINEAMCFAASNNQLDVVKFLEKPANGNEIMPNLALFAAAEAGHLPIVRHLVHGGAKMIDLAYQSALRYNRHEVCEYLTSPTIQKLSQQSRLKNVKSINEN